MNSARKMSGRPPTLRPVSLAFPIEPSSDGDSHRTPTPRPTPSDRLLTRDWLHATRCYLGGRRALLFGAAVVIAAGTTLDWRWLVAAGIAPLIGSILPCAAMCALGLCMHKKDGHGKFVDPASSRPER